MARVSSAKEGRLWVAVGAVLVAIYSTLGVAAELADELTNRRLWDALFAWVFVGIVALAVVQGLRLRAGAAEVVVVALALFAYVLVFLRMAIPEERTHLIEYGIIAVLVHAALTERQLHLGVPRRPAGLAFVLTTVAGIADEMIQLFLPRRVFDWRDVLFNTVAAGMTLGTIATLRAVRSRRPARRAAG